VICHQVGTLHRDTILKSLGIPAHKDFSTFEYLGNIGTVSLPLSVPLPPPVPVPTPVPPGPGPDTNPDDDALALAVRNWAQARHAGSNKDAARAVNRWLLARGFTQ